MISFLSVMLGRKNVLLKYFRFHRKSNCIKTLLNALRWPFSRPALDLHLIREVLYCAVLHIKSFAVSFGQPDTNPLLHAPTLSFVCFSHR